MAISPKALAAPPNPAMPITFSVPDLRPCPLPAAKQACHCPSGPNQKAPTPAGPPISGRKAGEIETGSGEVEVLLAKRLHHIAMHGHTSRFCKRNNLVNRLNNTSLVVSCHHRYKSSRSSCIIKAGEHLTKRGEFDAAFGIDRNAFRVRSGLHHRIMFDRAGDDIVEHRQGEVIGLSSAAGKYKIRAAASCQYRNFRSCLFDNHPRCTAITMNR